tara:strand:+ start:3316 stop:3762 length:447 start_codon:yes stop_codon:yes gene_type:complete
LLSKELKSAWKILPTTVGVLLITDNNSIYGITINSYFSVSLEHSLLAISLSNESNTKTFIDNKLQFSLCILSNDQKEYAYFFSKKNKESIPDSFEFLKNSNGLSYIKNSSVIFFCKPKSSKIVEDHTVVFCKINDVILNNNEPLIWKF